MSKYSQEALQNMAEIAEDARKNHDPRYLVLLTEVAQRTGLPINTVRVKIQELAIYGQTN